MREILFRGKRVDNGGWVEGCFVHLDNGRGKARHRIYTGDAETDCDDFYPEAYDVILETVGQYTGLDDKNGVKIFEGDILLEKNTGYKAVVEWQQDACRFIATIINRNSVNSPNFFYVDKGNDRGCKMSSNEVIGIIWDNSKGLD